MLSQIHLTKQLQVAEKILCSKTSTVRWDRTTLKSQHIIEVHISTEKENVLGVSMLAGGKAND